MRTLRIDSMKVLYDGKPVGSVLEVKSGPEGVYVTLKIDDERVKRWVAAGCADIVIDV